MGETKDNKIKTLLDDIDKEFQMLAPSLRAKFAIEQISVWQRKFNEAKGQILKEDFVDATSEPRVIGQDAEIDS